MTVAKAHTFGRYRVTKTLGAGAMGEVFEAIDDVLGREVAIKTLRSASGVTARFIDDLEEAFRLIERQPGTGSPRYGHELHIADLRSCRLRAFPHVVLYILRNDALDVLRVLHGARDIPYALTGPEPD